MLKFYEKLLRLFYFMPYGFSFDKDRWSNIRCAKDTIRLCNDLKIIPFTLVDVGANKSQWSIWLKRKWKNSLNIISFEPNINFVPKGDNIFRLALTNSNRDDNINLVDNGGSSYISDTGTLKCKACRFDSLEIKIVRPAILKVDCENFTYKALEGFGERLKEFDVIVCEMWNYYSDLPQFVNQQLDIWKLMLSIGKKNCRVLDAVLTAKDGIPSYDIAFY